MTLKVLEQSISSLYKTGEGSPLEEALEAYRSRLQEKEAILVNEQQVTIPDICHFFTQAKILENKIYTEKTRK